MRKFKFFSFLWLAFFSCCSIATCSEVPLHYQTVQNSIDTYPDDNDLSETAVIMVTCRKFEQAWDPFFYLFQRYWPDCPYKVYMISDTGTYPDVDSLEIGVDLGFSDNLIVALNKIPERYVIYFQEDYFFNAPFNSEKIRKFVRYLKGYSVSCIRLAPCPGPIARWDHNSSLGVIQPGEPYRISTQTAIWNKSFLLSILKHGESGGSFEIDGSQRVNSCPALILSVWRGETPTPYYITGIVKGVWQEDALALLRKEGIPTDHIQKVIH